MEGVWLLRKIGVTPEERRARMVERDIRGRGIDDPLVLAAVAQVPRERFVPEKLQQHAYDDIPLPIPGGQTISQPYIVCAMIASLGLRGGECALDVGTGSGYAAAVISRIAGQVYTVECVPRLARDASDVFREIGYDNILVIEAFGLSLENLVAATKIWRLMYENEKQLATDGLAFMKAEVAKRW